MSFEQPPAAFSAGEKKVREYVDRIHNGESIEKIMDGLPNSFRTAIERELGDGNKSIWQEKTTPQGEHAEFKETDGETQEGFWWHSFRNRSAQRLKEEGIFEWGKERIYFDLPYAAFQKLEKTLIRLAGDHSLPIAFKYVDAEKTYASNMDGSETRFVANFASVEDAKKMYDLLRSDPEYQSITPDRRLDYGGLRIDDLAEYSGGFREQREPLKRIIMNARLIGFDRYAYEAPSGKRIEITEKEYAHFRKMNDELTEKIARAEAVWK